MLLITVLAILISSSNGLDYSTECEKIANQAGNTSAFCVNFIKTCTSILEAKHSNFKSTEISCDKVLITGTCRIKTSGEVEPAPSKKIDLSGLAMFLIDDKNCDNFFAQCRDFEKVFRGIIEPVQYSCGSLGGLCLYTKVADMDVVTSINTTEVAETSKMMRPIKETDFNLTELVMALIGNAQDCQKFVYACEKFEWMFLIFFHGRMKHKLNDCFGGEKGPIEGNCIFTKVGGADVSEDNLLSFHDKFVSRLF